MHKLFVRHVMVQPRHEWLLRRTELTCWVWHGTVEEPCPKQLQVLCHLGLLKPGIHTGPVANNWQVLGVLSSSRDVVRLEAAWGKATPRHYSAERCCHGGAGWHPATSRELWLWPKSFTSRQGDRTKLAAKASWVKPCTDHCCCGCVASDIVRAVHKQGYPTGHQLHLMFGIGSDSSSSLRSRIRAT